MKNKYCRRTKLSEDTFLLILAGYCAGLTATDTRAAILEQNLKVSRQAVEEKFIDLGRYFYVKWARRAFIDGMRHANPNLPGPVSDDEFEIMVLHALWVSMRGEFGYAEAREFNINYPGPPELIDALRERWRLFQGLTEDTFVCHVGYAAYASHPTVMTNPERGYEIVKKHLELDPL